MAHGPFQAVSEFVIYATSTISQDHALGQRAEEDLNLASFGRRLSSHLLESEDQNQKSDEPQTSGTNFNGYLSQGNNALQDYQIQLTLLEQQNKKIFLMECAEKDIVNKKRSLQAELETEVYENGQEGTPRPLKSVTRIRDLEVFPLRYATDEEKNYLLRRGQKVWNLRYQTLATYTGWDSQADHYYVVDRSPMHDRLQDVPKNPSACRSVFVFVFVRTIVSFDKWPETIPLNAVLDQNYLALLPPHVHGVFLNEKKWVTLLVDNVGEVTWNKDAYKHLVLPEKTKDLVKALVMVRTSKRGESQGMSLTGKKRMDDLIAGKGNGLTMLLHGGPGTGKTLTAESVAEIAEMPLYNLQMVLVLGKTWNCVLLLDEADVFLEERTLSDLERNSLVSVFLRTLEYYDGILILTSNRVGTFDEAFESRIQVALYYPNLDKASRKKIWKNFFDMLEDDEEDVNLDELNRHMDELGDQEMNGRQIRNVLSTARQLALYQKETLGWEQLEQAIRTARDFNKYLRTLHGHTDDQYAREKELR
ncbi:hypothetical protein B0A49_00543 [Cryomyces minteri]|uniref:AAA+ ATPase domain-containing protein n=1 Tax=Cryomyces minteri TaxID=331657 RepID=A0A4U0XXT9_9PEZI|nr:hypothetical protein B0A49_00543 [Cryomyces minteri]